MLSDVPLGYTRIAGYERYAPHGKPLAPVPGAGPILRVEIIGGACYATRATGKGADVLTWRATSPDGWIQA